MSHIFIMHALYFPPFLPIPFLYYTAFLLNSKLPFHTFFLKH